MATRKPGTPPPLAAYAAPRMDTPSVAPLIRATLASADAVPERSGPMAPTAAPHLRPRGTAHAEADQGLAAASTCGRRASIASRERMPPEVGSILSSWIRFANT
ncbi:hypothetical protein EPIRMAN_GEN20615_09100 [Ralstonia mannitolilytica]|uniref:Uncharacterized protein n=1 Tax=Ralstonia mannitolilytica TaxID=105219 RepID=A0AAJ5D7S7_9RALS|nr:hypothetical protein LMG6866_00623 [Ralstonia mannitolilytica]CAJ0730888.1 hypothetical protein R77592_02487 [Ralstonia mannitolilytica]CAJ0731240.1 hypothetical protein R76706_02642 [Ralstonia mannitolilytica]CAJ0787627.1 hypothetical protein R77555_01640 [Ralstonia mannitolilytica]SUE24869.1 Uncharacterised protein [Ralstonia mannitolilytica]